VLSINPAAKGMARSGIREIMNAVWGRPDVIRLEVRERNGFQLLNRSSFCGTIQISPTSLAWAVA
jgi:hypothetical protein